MTFIDTGILVGSVLAKHPKHSACREGLSASEQPITNAHVFAEVFSTLTGFYKVPNTAATDLVFSLEEHIAVETLSWADYQITLREARARGVMGGGIYDALHATFARRKGASKIVTLNPSHFLHVAPDLEILTP